MRNLDLTTLRSFVAVADHGGVTRAAGMLNLTQSAVSMQLKRLEELLGIDLLDRTGRKIALTSSGDQLLTYARRMVAMNDEVVERLTEDLYEGEIILGVPHDVVYPVIPRVLKAFNTAYPRVKVQLISSSTVSLLERLSKGSIDLILTTEESAGPGGETLTEMPLRWVGAHDGQEWRKRPLRLAFCKFCIFRPIVTRKLDEMGIAWEMAVESDEDRAVEALVSADLAVGALLEDSIPPHLEAIAPGGALPDLGVQQINLYGAMNRDEVMRQLSDLIRQGYGGAQAAGPALVKSA
ncbi:LysR family transcriptional regulator [Alisedimentitalea sp. MJ-SS2]|uniref:LysR family transcriptional regulator n=1 Tax=Aliisedimentitalea sp. MJ-SS2 TaxID=3049795 RepID=UPI0029154086|nr:LysR family transcriptional regulator [Alisedimentitalea sp. MJ-SS2]MDU8929581.1 LysR family transcriptional regulator [Alisedimentitalea sp. MJ-SS2]